MTENQKSKELINAIFSHNEIASSMVSISFVTSKATNDEPDLISYNFVNPTLEKIEDGNAEIILTFKWEFCFAKDLRTAFFDAGMQKKYDEKAPKNVDVDTTGGEERVARCEVCGKEINTYDADITRATFGKAMCANCLEKYLESN